MLYSRFVDMFSRCALDNLVSLYDRLYVVFMRGIYISPWHNLNELVVAPVEHRQSLYFTSYTVQ